MGVKIKNNAFGVLLVGINTSATSVTLQTGQGANFPALGAGDYFYATLIDTSNNLEIVKVTARVGDVLTITRAQEGSTARAYGVGDRIELRLTAQNILDMLADGSLIGAGTIPASALASGAVVSHLGFTPLNKAGDTITGKVAYDGTSVVGSSSAANLAETTTIYFEKFAPLRNSSDKGLYIGPKDTNTAFVQVAKTDGTAAGDIWLNPYGGKVKLSPYPIYESAWVNIIQGGNYFFSHGLGRQPYMVRVYAKWDNVDDNKPWLCVGDLGVWDDPTTGGGSDRGVVAGVSNSLICVAVGEGGVATDWGNASSSNNGFPMNNNAFESFLSSFGQNTGNDFMDTPTEGAGVWGSPWVKVYAW